MYDCDVLEYVPVQVPWQELLLVNTNVSFRPLFVQVPLSLVTLKVCVFRTNVMGALPEPLTPQA